MNKGNYIPEVIDDNYVKFLSVVGRCRICNVLKLLITREQANRLYRGDTHLFPVYCKADLIAQMKRASIVFSSEIKDKDGYLICEDCAKKGKATFICALCEKEKASDLKQESFGDTPEFLCKDCYNTVSAKVWDKKVKELYDSHRWDFE